jgi:hypothetical protein
MISVEKTNSAEKRRPGRPVKQKAGLPEILIPTTRGSPVGGLEYLHEQAEDLKSLFADFARTGTGCVRTRRILLDELAEKLENYVRLKERVIIPIQQRSHDASALQCVEEISLIRALLRRIVRVEVTDKSLGAKVKLLEHLVVHHIEIEETARIPAMLRRQTNETVLSLAIRMEEESLRLVGLNERRHRLREHRRWLALREKDCRRFFGGYLSVQ